MQAIVAELEHDLDRTAKRHHPWGGKPEPAAAPKQRVATMAPKLARAREMSIRDLQTIVHELWERDVTLKATEQPIDTRTSAARRRATSSRHNRSARFHSRFTAPAQPTVTPACCNRQCTVNIGSNTKRGAVTYWPGGKSIAYSC